MKSNFCSQFFKIIFIVVILLISHNSKAQDKDPNFWSNVQYGGGLGISFGSNYFSGTISPSAVYRFNPRFALGLGLNFTYNTEKNFYESTIVHIYLIENVYQVGVADVLRAPI